MNTQSSNSETQTFFFGDVDYLLFGGMWIRSRDGYYDVYAIDPEAPRGTYVGSCSIHESDLQEREALIGMDIDPEDDPFLKVYGIISYWGVEHYGGSWDLAKTKKEVKQFLRQNNLK